MRVLRRVAALPLLLFVTGCPESPELRERALLDGRHEPEVLVETAMLEPPPATGGNRYLTGWRAVARRRGGLRLFPASGARIELVQLQRRRRVVIVRSEVRAGAQGRVTLKVGDRESGSQPVSERMRFALPADLPLGRVPLDFGFTDPDELAVSAVLLRPALPAGQAVFRDGMVVQSPWSSIDFVQRFEPGAVLLGGFQAPRSRGEEQRFSISIETEAGWQGRVFEWDGAAAQEIRVELPDSGGPTRVRLEATGAGEPGRWVDLRVAEPAFEPQPIAPPPAPRLVILYVFDALRADFVGHLGGPANISPELDRLAAEGVTFTDHLSVAPNTKPSIKSLFVGLPFLVRGHERLPSGGPPTLAESFAAAGYLTVLVSGSPWVGSSFGTDRGFRRRSLKAAYRSKERTGSRFNDSAERVHAASLEWIDALEPEQPAFLYLHTMHPHNPYDPPLALEKRFAGGIDSTIDGSTQTLLSIKQGRIETSPADRERLRALYAAGLAYNDAELEKFMAELRRRFEPGEVLIVFTSDHGEELFEHGGVLHGYTLYREQLEIPLVLWWPGVLPPRRVEVGTDHLDLAATLQSLVGAEYADRHGRPLWELMSGEDDRWPKRVRFAAASSVNGGIFMAQASGLKLILAPRVGTAWGMGQGIGRTRDYEYLFDLEADPGEHVNRAGFGGLEADWLRARLTAWIERGKLEELGSDVDEEVDEETLERLRALGYVD